MPSKPPLTHFLCLPLINEASRPHLRASLQRLTADLLNSNVLTDIPNPEKAIRPLGTLHLTLGVMSLTAPEKLAGAMSLLREMDVQQLMSTTQGAGAPESMSTTQAVSEMATASPAGPLTISLRSLASMHTPAKTSVLYSVPVDQTGRLQVFAGNVRQAFETAGFIAQEDRPLLLHATMVNTIYAAERKGRGGGRGRGRGGKSNVGKGRNRGKLTFDAVDIIERYSGFDFAKGIELDKIAICKMGAQKTMDADGQVLGEEYEVVAEKAL